MPAQPTTVALPTPPRRNACASCMLFVCTALIIATLIAADIALLLSLRESALRNSEANLRNISLALAEQADRALQGFDLVLTSMAGSVTASDADNTIDFPRKMAAESIHAMLREKLVGLPYINAVTMIDSNGNLINFSRYWPIPKVNVADRDYFAVLHADPTLRQFVSVPVQNRGDNVWTVYLARRAPSRDGSFTGLLLGAIELRWFEDFYRSVSLGRGEAISLMRLDGVELVRYPHAEVVGMRFPAGGPRALQGGSVGVIRDVSPVDGAFRIKAAARLANFPLFVLATQTETVVLQEWRRVAWVLSVVTAGGVIAILLAALAIGHWWRQQQSLGEARAEHAEALQARALAEAELAREREHVAEAENHAKSGFLAMMSHEIRTPMNAVLGLAGSLADAPLTPAQHEVVATIRSSGDSLLRILNDILDFSKLDAGRMMFEHAPFSPATLTHSALSVLGPRARAKGLAMTADTDPALPPGLLGDAGRIRQVLLNLASNAVKFTETGSVAIQAQCVGREGDAVTVEWSVRDTGIGIPPERIGQLFREFMQADSSIARRFGGSGLGLAISKRLVEQMGGSIGVESAPGVGTTFRVRLTLPVADAPVEPAPQQIDATAALQALLAALGRPLRVLFAEDNPTNQFVALQMLKPLRVHVDVVGDGLEAVDAASSFAYDLIFMDMRMPEMDGLAATRLIRRRGGSPARVPIIALTANAFPEDVKACMDAGMNLFITKPVSKEVLFSAILQALSLAPAPGSVTSAAVAQPAPPPFDAAALRALAADIGEDGVGEMLEVFQRETRLRLQRMAAPGIPPVALMREAHTVKGAAGAVCAPLLRRRAEAIETALRNGGSMPSDALAGLEDAFAAFTAEVEASGIGRPVLA